MKMQNIVNTRDFTHRDIVNTVLAGLRRSADDGAFRLGADVISCKFTFRQSWQGRKFWHLIYNSFQKIADSEFFIVSSFTVSVVEIRSRRSPVFVNIWFFRVSRDCWTSFSL